MPQFTKEALKKLKKEFEGVDKDKNGKVDKKELSEMFKNVQKNTGQKIDIDAMVKNIFNVCDHDKDGHIVFEEYINLAKIQQESPIDTLKKEFQKVDKDKDGLICKKELTIMFKNAMPKKKDKDISMIVNSIFKAFDTNKNSKIDFMEYVKFSS